MAEEGYFGSLFGFFVERVKRYVHIVLVMDPRNDSFRLRCESNPALYTKCVIEWWDSWTREGMSYIPQVLLGSMLEELPRKEELLKQILYIHDSCVPAGATPRDYVTLLSTYKTVYDTKRASALEQQSRLQAGLSKLSEAASVVDQLSHDAEQKKILLAEKQEQANQALAEITRNMETATGQRKETKALEEKLGIEKTQMEARKSEIEQKLSKIHPILDQAREAVGSIQSSNLAEIRSLKTPPVAIRDVCIMRSYQISYY